MVERLKNIPKQLLEFWKKFSKKQKILIISITGVIIIAFVILAIVLSIPQTVQLMTCEDTEQASEVVGILESSDIEYTTTSDGKTIMVNKEDEAKASLALGASGIPTTSYSISDALDGGFSTTESDKDRKYQLYMEEKLADELEASEYIEEAKVDLSIPDTSTSVLAESKETSANVILILKSELPVGAAEGFALAVKTAVGNETTDNITIIDNNGTVLFSGTALETDTAIADRQLDAKTKAEELMAEKVKKILLATKVYEAVTVSPNAVIDFDSQSSTSHEYTGPSDEGTGLATHEYLTESENMTGLGDTPGTDANDGDATTYELTDGSSTSSSTTSDIDYALNEYLTTTEKAKGTIVYDESSIAVVLNSWVVYDEEELEEQGLLEGMTFNEFKNANSDITQVEVGDDIYENIARATGIDVENISIIANQIPTFIEAEETTRSITSYLQIILFVIIVGLLGFVVFKSSRPVEVTELEPELSVEDLLETTKLESDLENIEVNDKSDARRAVERFVDENPEAVALLFKNWLDDDEWG